jgi:hypothetical protein
MLAQQENDLGKSGCFAILLGLGLLGFSAYNLFWEARYRMEGAQTTGTVTYVWTQATKRGREDYGYYEFRVGGKSFTGKARSVSAGSAVDVEYLRSDPRTCRLTQERVPPAPWFIGGGLALLAFGIFRFVRFDNLGVRG